MSPRHPYPSRSTGSTSSLDLPFPLSVAQDDDDTLDMWWPSSVFNTRPVLSERVSEFVKRAEGGDRLAIVNALQFSRRLGICYNVACVLFPIGVFVVRKTLAKIERQRRTKRKKEKGKVRVREEGNETPLKKDTVEISVTEVTSANASSSSSASNVPIGDVDDKSKPLLQKPSKLQIPWYTLLYRRIKGYLGYQRPNDRQGRVMPTNGISFVNGFFFFLTIFLAIYRIYWPRDTINNAQLRFFLMADRWGIIFAMNQPLNYLLAAKTSPIKYLTGWSYEQHVIFHMAVSVMSLYSSLFHFAGMYGVYRMFIAPTGQTFLDILTHRDILFGVLSFTSFWIFGFLSTDKVRSKSYELFLTCHIIFSGLAMSCLYFHHKTTRIYVVWAMIIWIVDRIVYRAYRKRWTAEATVKVLDESTVRVTMKNFGGTNRQLTNGSTAARGGNWKWEPASHVFLTVPGWSRFQAHPFTILSAPAGHDLDFDGEAGQWEGKDTVLVVRKLEGFTAGLFDMADSEMKVNVVVDGPYGSNHARETLRDCQKCIFIAGGSGIAVVWPLMCEVIRRETEKAKVRKIKKMKIVLMWLVMEEKHHRWCKEELEELERAERAMPRELEVEVRKYVTRGPSGFRPDLATEITNIVEDDTGTERKSGVVVCGPDGMVRQVRSTGYDLLWKGRDVEIMAEKFGW
ncbi:hypothetical protein H072_5267 [Dactylellina haptotyla CBS 200.50]|uniref:FAD-binding FR-type domain-containing protein n=1 Tax=Dactylellina haptotyla (strain CBS 200.50) TaxID=1284197 RepID=S8AD53_DACHA|nr:hypothetical protein H072_5267 [Dactylellina haptotyla CBS 200.50]